jgi:lipopolysaccharide export system permease protein
VLDIRADIGAAILNEGEFNTPTNGLTVFIRELSPTGISAASWCMTIATRCGRRPISPKAACWRRHAGGARLIMLDGTIEQSSLGGAQLSVLKFKRYVFDLDQFAGPQQDDELETSERFLPELFWPVRHVDTRRRNAISPRPTTGSPRRSIVWPSR